MNLSLHQLSVVATIICLHSPILLTNAFSPNLQSTSVTRHTNNENRGFNVPSSSTVSTTRRTRPIFMVENSDDSSNNDLTEEIKPLEIVNEEDDDDSSSSSSDMWDKLTANGEEAEEETDEQTTMDIEMMHQAIQMAQSRYVQNIL